MKISNAFGTSPLLIGAAAIGVRDRGAAIVAHSGKMLTSLGAVSAIVVPGASILSDPVSLSVRALSDIAVDLYLPNDTLADTSPITIHADARQTNYVSTTGNSALAEHTRGNAAQSDAALAQLRTDHGHVAAYQIAEAYAWRGEADRVCEWLERAYTQRDPGLAHSVTEPFLKRVHNDPRGPGFLLKMGFA